MKLLVTLASTMISLSSFAFFNTAADNAESCFRSLLIIQEVGQKGNPNLAPIAREIYEVHNYCESLGLKPKSTRSCLVSEFNKNSYDLIDGNSSLKSEAKRRKACLKSLKNL